VTTRIRFADGSDVSVLLSGKRIVEELARTSDTSDNFARFKAVPGHPVWVNPEHVACVEELDDGRPEPGSPGPRFTHDSFSRV